MSFVGTFYIAIYTFYTTGCYRRSVMGKKKETDHSLYLLYFLNIHKSLYKCPYRHLCVVKLHFALCTHTTSVTHPVRPVTANKRSSSHSDHMISKACASIWKPVKLKTSFLPCCGGNVVVSTVSKCLFYPYCFTWDYYSNAASWLTEDVLYYFKAFSCISVAILFPRMLHVRGLVVVVN